MPSFNHHQTDTLNANYFSISPEELKKIIDDAGAKIKNEKNWLEFKKTSNSIEPRQIAALLNSYGGMIIIGIDERAEDPLVGISTEFSSKSLFNNIDVALKKYENDINCEHYVDIDTIPHRDKQYGIVRIKPLKTRFVIFDGKIYYGRNISGESIYLKNYRELTEFILKRLQNRTDVIDYLELLSSILSQYEIVSLWSAALQTHKTVTKKEMTMLAQALYPRFQELLSAGILPRPINLAEYERLRKKLAPILYLNEPLRKQETMLYGWLQDFDSIVGNEIIVSTNLGTFVKRLHAFKTSRSVGFLAMLSDAPTAIQELKGYFAPYA